MNIKLEKYDRESIFICLSEFAKNIYYESNTEISLICIIVDELRSQTSFLSSDKEMTAEYLLSSLIRVLPDKMTDKSLMQLIKEARHNNPNVKKGLKSVVEEVLEFDSNKLN